LTQRKLLVISLALGLITAFMVYSFVRASVSPANPEKSPEVEVVIAQEEIRPKTMITAQMLAVRVVPRAQANPAALGSIAEAIGRLAKETIQPGEQVLNTRLYARDEKPGLTFVIPAGKRAVSVAVNEVIGVAGFVKPGDRVDVLGTFDESVVGKTVTTTVLQDVEVLAIAQRMEDEDTAKARVATTVTLALSLSEAEKITLAEEQGRLRLVLRPAGQEGKEYVAQTSTAQLTQGRSGQSLTSIVPGAKTPTKNATPTVTSPEAVPDVKAKVDDHQESGWTVELYRGVSRQVVSVEDTSSL
jgi:pilus assembly protein CpaB